MFIRYGRKVHEAKRMNIRYIQAETSALGQDTHTRIRTQAHLAGHTVGGGGEKIAGVGDRERYTGHHSHVASGKLSTQH